MAPRLRPDGGFPWVVDDVYVADANICHYGGKLRQWLQSRGIDPDAVLVTDYRNCHVCVCNGCGRVYAARSRTRCLRHSREECELVRLRFGAAVPRVVTYEQRYHVRGVIGSGDGADGGVGQAASPAEYASEQPAVPAHDAGSFDDDGGAFEAGSAAAAVDGALAASAQPACAHVDAWVQLDSLAAAQEATVFHDLWEDPAIATANDFLADIPEEGVCMPPHEGAHDVAEQPVPEEAGYSGNRLWDSVLGLNASA